MLNRFFLLLPTINFWTLSTDVWFKALDRLKTAGCLTQQLRSVTYETYVIMSSLMRTFSLAQKQNAIVKRFKNFFPYGRCLECHRHFSRQFRASCKYCLQSCLWRMHFFSNYWIQLFSAYSGSSRYKRQHFHWDRTEILLHLLGALKKMFSAVKLEMELSTNMLILVWRAVLSCTALYRKKAVEFRNIFHHILTGI